MLNELGGGTAAFNAGFSSDTLTCTGLHSESRQTYVLSQGYVALRSRFSPANVELQAVRLSVFPVNISHLPPSATASPF